MKIQTKKSERIELILNFLKKCKREDATFTNIIDYVNNNASINYSMSKRTFESDLQSIRNDFGIEIEVEREGNFCYYSIDKEAFAEEIMGEDFGIILQLINTHKELESVEWLKGILQSDYNIDESYFDNDDFFVLPKPKNKIHDKILKLAIEIVKYAKKGQAIQFYYQPANKEKKPSAKCVAPLQVRFFDGRYYMIALDLIDDMNYLDYSNTPIVYSLDSIEGLIVYPGQKESKIEDEPFAADETNIYFDYIKLRKKINLKNYFINCIGIYRPKNEEPKVIKLKFTDWARSYVLNQPIHTSQKVIISGEELIVEIFVYDTFELDFSLARFRGFCVRLD
ncbi:MAG: WYL domain-containing protein [Bacteroidia bacterium]|nr:WYL domain-containing protein [Bacteroidia bacterium]